MIQGISHLVQGMITLQQKQDQISNNLANVNTTGYKSSSLFAKSYQKHLLNDELDAGVIREIKADVVHVDYSEGPTKATGNDLDMMVKGSGFFTVMTDRGIRYTRNGNFSLNPDGFLITTDGSKVMGLDGFLQLDMKELVTVNNDGMILQGNVEKGILRIADFKKPYRLLRDGNALFKPLQMNNPIIKSPGFAIKQGFIEGSNANPVRNMVEMISAFRNYEADQKAMQAHDQTLDKAVNMVGRIN